MIRICVVKKKGDEWCVFTADGKTELGCHATEKKANDQLAAIEISKQKNAQDNSGFLRKDDWKVSAGSPRILQGTADVAQMRVAEFDGKSHLVVPVIAIMEGVIHAVNSETPELVLAEELLKCYAGFNGRPVVAGHPTDATNERVSANDPKVLEREQFGQTFNTKIENNQLKTEAWIDPVQAEKNDRAKGVVRRLRSGEMVEVSVGVFVATEPTAGEKDGKDFKGIWRSIVPDHLAFLAEGIEGACSIEMGCGAPRAAQEGVENMTEEEAARLRKLSSEERIRKFSVLEAQSDTDLRDALNRALQEIEPGFIGVDAVFAEEGSVVYSTLVNDNWRFMKRSFTQNEKGVIKLKVDAIEVRPVTRFELLESKPQEEKKTMDEKLKARLEALIANKRNAFIPCDIEILAKFSEERIAALEAACKEPEPVKKPEQKLEPEGPTDLEKFTKEIGMSADEIKSTVEATKKAIAEKKTALITALKAAQEAYSEEDLKKMDVGELEKLAKVVPQKIDGVTSVDFSLKAGSSSNDGKPEEGVPPPTNIFEAFSPPAK